LDRKHWENPENHRLVEHVYFTGHNDYGFGGDVMKKKFRVIRKWIRQENDYFDSVMFWNVGDILTIKLKRVHE